MNVGFGYEASTNGAGGDERTVTAVLRQAPGAEILRSRPELLVGAAFAGGVIAALLLRRLGR